MKSCDDCRRKVRRRTKCRRCGNMACGKCLDLLHFSARQVCGRYYRPEDRVKP